MRFLLVAPQYLPTAGGVERYTHDLAAKLVELGHAAVVATSALPGLPARQTEDDGVEVVRLPARFFIDGRFPLPRKTPEFKRLAGELWRRPYDLVVINTRFYPLSLWAAGQCKKRGQPAIVIEHGTKHLSLDNALLNVFGNAYEHAAMKRMRRRCDVFYGVSRACCEWLLHFKVTARGVLYNAVDAEALERAAEAAGRDRDFRADYGLDANAPLIAFVGRFIVEKGVRELLAAFETVRAAHPGAALVMAGDGPLYAEVAGEKRPGVFLPGQLPYAETMALLSQSDVFCLPTYSEGFSSTILEAAALGCCIITTPTGGSPELISDGQSGILLKSRQPQVVAEALAAVLGDASFRQSAGAAVRDTVRKQYTWRHTAEKLLGIAQEKAPQG